jgi:hypothetical protein
MTPTQGLIRELNNSLTFVFPAGFRARRMSIGLYPLGSAIQGARSCLQRAKQCQDEVTVVTNIQSTKWKGATKSQAEKQGRKQKRTKKEPEGELRYEQREAKITAESQDTQVHQVPREIHQNATLTE